MQASRKRTLADGREYNKYFPEARQQDRQELASADEEDTLALIQKVVNRTTDQTARIAKVLRGRTLEETCRNIFEFVYRHIQYKLDEPGNEQIRQPARTWADRFKGVDCDCYTTFISSILTNLGIPHVLRVTAYQRDWQHIYPIVPLDGDVDKYQGSAHVDRNEYLAIDCVTDYNNYEVPYSRKKDYIMKLTELSGLGEAPTEQKYSIDAIELGELEIEPVIVRQEVIDGVLVGWDAEGNEYVAQLDGLGNIFKWAKKTVKKAATAVSNTATKVATAVKTTVTKSIPTVIKAISTGGIKGGIDALGETAVGKAFRKTRDGVLNAAGKAIHFLNRAVNPATILIRNGVLICMKLNVLRVAEKLRLAYLPYAQANAISGIDQANHTKLTNILKDLEKAYYVAGGIPVNLKKAILNGKGNRDNKVPKDNSPITQVNDASELVMIDNIDGTGKLKNGHSIRISEEWSPQHGGYQVYINNQRNGHLRDLTVIDGVASGANKLGFYHNDGTSGWQKTEGLKGLGIEPATAALITSGLTVVGGIAIKLLEVKTGKKMPPLPPVSTGDPEVDKRNKEAYQQALLEYGQKEVVKSFAPAPAPTAPKTPAPAPTAPKAPAPAPAPKAPAPAPAPKATMSVMTTAPATTQAPAPSSYSYLDVQSSTLAPQTATAPAPTVEPEKEKKFYENPLVVGGIVAAGMVAVGGAIYLSKDQAPSPAPAPVPNTGISGVPKRRKRTTTTTKRKRK
jgi:hypothetical protein